MSKRYLTRQEAASYLSEHGLTVSKNTLQKFATTGGGPAYRIFGNRALYTAETLHDWAEARLTAPRKSTSEAA
jgi:excisionase family DNA binding protein